MWDKPGEVVALEKTFCFGYKGGGVSRTAKWRGRRRSWEQARETNMGVGQCEAMGKEGGRQGKGRRGRGETGREKERINEKEGQGA